MSASFFCGKKDVADGRGVQVDFSGHTRHIDYWQLVAG